MRVPLSGLVIARNEGHHLAACLASFEDLPVTVIDHGSTDDTVTVARSAGARVVEASGSLSALRALGARSVKSQWVLSLDADERLSPGALNDIRAAISSCPSEVAAFRLEMRTYLGATRLRGRAYRPRPIRLYRPERVTWRPLMVHERPDVAGRVGILPIVIDHACYVDLDHAREKTRRYAAWAALDLQSRGRVQGWASTWFRAGWRWVRAGLLQGGLAGPFGWQLTTLQAAGVLWRGRWSRLGVPASAARPPAAPFAPAHRHLRE